jgi:hypothetical protein
VRRAVATVFAIVLSCVIIATVVAIVVPQATFVAGALALLTIPLGLVITNRTQRTVSIILLVVGGAALAVAVALGARPELPRLLSVNQDLIAMLSAVSFLGLIALETPPRPPRLRGAAAVWRTVGVIHFLGAVINMSAVTIVGDHLRRDGTLRPADTMLLTRGYGTGAFWSPFWAASALALTFAPTTNMPVLMAVGLILALGTLAPSMVSVFRSLGPELADYRGYALSWALLRVPLALTATVLTVHLLVPSTPIPRIVALSGVAVTATVLLFRHAASALRRFARQARDGLPALRGEVTLFASAGVLSIGVGSLLELAPIVLPFTEFGVPVAWLCTVGIILLSLVGVHPVISMGVAAAIVAPLDPQPTLFALAAVIGWGTAAAVGPLSGLQMYLVGRYRVDSIATTRRNLPFVGIVLVLAWPALYAVSLLAGG